MNYRNARAGLIVCVAALLVLNRLCGLSLWWIALPVAVFEALLVYGSSLIASEFFTKVHCRADTRRQEIALTFDDGPDPEFTPRVLSKLADFGATAAFFLIGSKIEGNEELLRRMDAAGHTLGNHTFTHSYFVDFKNFAGFISELNRTAEAIERAVGKRVRLFRPPFGVTTPQLAKAVEALGYAVVGWSIRSLDTTLSDEERIARRVVERIRPGAVILLHDSSDKTVRVLERVLRYARDNGYAVVGLERLLGLEAYREPLWKNRQTTPT